MKKFSFLMAFFFLVSLFMIDSCKSPSSPNEQGAASQITNTSNNSTATATGVFEIIMKDKPVDEATYIWVTLNRIVVHKAGGPDSFIEVSDEEQTFDLLELKANPQPIVTATLEAGHYNQIILTFVSGEIVFTEEEVDVPYPLELPPGQEEIKIPVQFEIAENGETEIILDFDAENSIHVVQKPKKGDTYRLRPVIHVVKVNNSES